MSKERLEEIIHKEAYLEGTNNLVMVINTDDYKWLIKQAERVQELEEELEKGETLLEKILPIYKRLKKQNKRYREALEFYAEPKNWLPQNEDVLSLITMDYGNKARKVLEVNK